MVGFPTWKFVTQPGDPWKRLRAHGFAAPGPTRGSRSRVAFPSLGTGKRALVQALASRSRRVRFLSGAECAPPGGVKVSDV